jgi:hypothetical protein
VPTDVFRPEQLRPGDFYEDCSFHPCLCVEVDSEGTVSGISLVDGTRPRSCSIGHCGVRKLSLEEAIRWRVSGPDESPVGVGTSRIEPWW